jgi:hypothetical protein
MNELSQVIHQITGNEFSVIAAFFLLLFMILYLNRKRISQTWQNIKIRYCLNHLGQKQILNIRCPDGLDDYFIIDRLILRTNGITVLVYKKYPGKIFCADNIDEWIQMIGQKSFPFKNPLFELDYQIKAISACVPGIDVDGYLFFDHLAEFPKGHPQRVINTQVLPQPLKRNKQLSVEPDVLSAWNTLQSFKTE